MTISNILNIIGLSFDIIGVLMLFKFGLPPEINRSGLIAICCEEEDENEKVKAKKYDKFSRIALGLIVFGFVFQLLSDFPIFNINIDDFRNCITKYI